MGHRTPLYDAHLAAGAKIVDFGGWDMPIHYGSQLEEHHAVRQHAGMFDVSHMTIVEIGGAAGEAYLRHLLANDVGKMTVGRALYTAMLNERGGVIDDLIVYKGLTGFRVVVNCATREKDLDWMEKQADGYSVDIRERPDLAMIAIQGPKTRDIVKDIVCEHASATVRRVKPFSYENVNDWMIAGTGYTGEDGVEIILPSEDTAEFWQRLRSAGIRPIGLGARDTLRLEAGLNLYGNDMDENTTPWEANMGWTVDLGDADRAFVGRDALEQQKTGSHAQLVGLVLEGKGGVLRAHQKVLTPAGDGEITSGSFSPTLGGSVALARLPAGVTGQVDVEIRDKRLPAQVVRPPFVRSGKAVFKPL